MKLKHKILAYSMIPALLGVGFIGINSVSANGLFGGGYMNNLSIDEIATRQQAMFQNEADILGITVNEVKDAWASGKSFMELAKEKGLTGNELQAKLKAAREQQLKTELQALVTRGIITQAQADKRLATMQNQQKNIKTKMGKRHGLGQGMGMGF